MNFVNSYVELPYVLAYKPTTFPTAHNLGKINDCILADVKSELLSKVVQNADSENVSQLNVLS